MFIALPLIFVLAAFVLIVNIRDRRVRDAMTAEQRRADNEDTRAFMNEL